MVRANKSANRSGLPEVASGLLLVDTSGRQDHLGVAEGGHTWTAQYASISEELMRAPDRA